MPRSAGMLHIVVYVQLLFAAIAAAEDGLDATRVSALEAEVVSMRREMADQRREIASLRKSRAPTVETGHSAVAPLMAEVTELRAQLKLIEAKLDAQSKPLARSKGNETAVRRMSVDKDGATASVDGRRLANGDTHLAVAGWQLHEFPAGHTCPNMGSAGTTQKRLLPHTGSEVSWLTSVDWTASTADELSLNAIGSQWGTSEIQRMPFPLKVVHNADCTATPTLELAMDTNIPGQLTVGGFNILRDSGPIIDPLAWDIDTTKCGLANDAGVFGGIYMKRNSDGEAYYMCAATKKPVSYFHLFRPYSASGRHVIMSLSQTPTGNNDPSVDYTIWMSAAQENNVDGARTTCAGQDIMHGQGAYPGAGSTHPPDDEILADSDSNDLYIMKIEGTTLSFYAAKFDGGATPFRTCTIPAGDYYAKFEAYAAGQYTLLPAIKWA